MELHIQSLPYQDMMINYDYFRFKCFNLNVLIRVILTSMLRVRFKQTLGSEAQATDYGTKYATEKMLE